MQRRLLPTALVAALGVLGVVTALLLAGKGSAALLLGDVRGLVALPVWAGWLSDIGILIWISSASVCLFVGLTLGIRNAGGRFFLATAALTGWLAVDDSLMLHERVLPRLLGVGQGAIYAVYATVVLCWLIAYRRRHAGTLPVWLVLSFACFAASVLLDVLPPERRPPARWHPLIEDGFKWIGIVLWSARLWCVCLLEHASPAGRKTPGPAGVEPTPRQS